MGRLRLVPARLQGHEGWGGWPEAGVESVLNEYPLGHLCKPECQGGGCPKTLAVKEALSEGSDAGDFGPSFQPRSLYSFLCPEACVAAASLDWEWSQPLHRRERRLTYGWSGGLPWRPRQCGPKSLVLEMTNGWGNAGGDPEGGGTHEVCWSRLSPARPLLPPSAAMTAAVSIRTRAHGPCAEQNPTVGVWSRVWQPILPMWRRASFTCPPPGPG